MLRESSFNVERGRGFEDVEGGGGGGGRGGGIFGVCVCVGGSGNDEITGEGTEFFP